MASGKTLQSTIEISGVLSPSLQSAINGAVDRLAEMAEETLESADAASRLVAEMDAQEDILKNMQRAYAGYVASGAEGSEQAQELAKRIRVVSGELEENRETLQAAERAANALTDRQGDTADAYAALERKISSQQDELTALRRQYANVALEQGESSDEARQLASRISSLSGELNENKQKLNAAERAADSLGDALEDAGEKAEDSSEGYTVLKNVIANLVTEGIDKAVDAFKELATEGDTSLALLEARTGASAAKMEGFEDVMYEVYNANYGENLGDVSDTLSTVIQMTDNLNNASLAKVTKNSIALSDVFGFDTTESLRAVNSLMDQFGITSDQAYNLIVQGAQNGLNQNDDLLDTINEYSVQFKSAGYTADDMFNMLANGAETGTWSVDKLGDAVKEFNIRMSDGSASEYLEQLGVDVDTVMEQFNKGGPDAQKAIGTVMKAIQKCDDATLQYQAGVGLFGTMWEDLGADTVASLMSTEGAIDSTTDAMGKMSEAAYDTLEGSLSQLGRTIKSEVVQPIVDKLTPAIKDCVDVVTSKVGPTVDWVLAHLPEIGVALGSVGAVIAAMKWGSIVSGIGKAIGAFKGMWAAIVAVPAPVLAVIGIVAALAAGFVYLWKTNEGFRDRMTQIWEELKGSFSELGGVFSGMIDQIGPVLSELASTVLTAFGQIAEALIPMLAELVASILPVVIDLIGQLVPVIMQVVEAVLGVLVQLLQTLLPVLVQIVQTVLPVLLQIIQALLPVIMQIVEGVLPALVQLIETLLPIVMQIVNGVLPVIVQLVQLLLPVIMQIVQAVLPILIDLINSLLPLVMQIITTVLPVLMQILSEVLPVLIEIVVSILPILVDFIGQLLPLVMQIVQVVLPILVQLIQTLLPIIAQIVQAVLPVLVQLIQLLLPIVVQIIQTVLPVMVQLIQELLPLVLQIIQTVLPVFIQLIQTLLPIIMQIIQTVLPILVQLIQTLLPVITQIIEAVLPVLVQVLNILAPILKTLASIITTVLGAAIQAILPIIEALTGVFQGLIDFITGVFSGNWSKAWSGIVKVFGSLWDGLVGIVKAPINAVIGLINKAIGALNGISVDIPDWVPVMGGKKFGINIPKIPMLATGGFTDGISIAGEKAMEAVISFDPAYREKNIGIWEKAGQLLGVLGNEEQGAGLTSKAGELLTLDDFSLGSLADGTSIVIYYDFSGFTWSPQIQSGNGEDEDDLMARLKAHEAEFFDWLEEFIQMREVALYGS